MGSPGTRRECKKWIKNIVRRNIRDVYKIDGEIRKAAITVDVSEAAGLISEALNDIGGGVAALINRYPYDDLPLVMASLLITYNALCSVVGPNGKALADGIAQMTNCVAINLAELAKQVRDEGRAES